MHVMEVDETPNADGTDSFVTCLVCGHNIFLNDNTASYFNE